MNRLILAILIPSALLIAVETLSADIYSWKDENGVVHYSDIEPVAPGTRISVESAISHDAAADEKRSETDHAAVKAIRQQTATEDRQEDQRESERQQKIAKAKAPSREETIAAEKKRLEETIADLEAKPLSDFGSAKNKRLQLGFYNYKLEELQQDPDKYFGWKAK